MTLKVFYVTATSFPEGILDAHVQLHHLVPFSIDRNYFGISRLENNGAIIYRAAAEEKSTGEAEKYYCDTLILEKGKYISVTLTDFREDPQNIGKAFKDLLTIQDLDPEGYSVEKCVNGKEEVKCIIKLKND